LSPSDGDLTAASETAVIIVHILLVIGTDHTVAASLQSQPVILSHLFSTSPTFIVLCKKLHLKHLDLAADR